MPAHHPRPPARPVSCYALLGRMAASKPTSRLSVQADLVNATQAALGGLGRWSGFFPSRARTLAPAPSLPGMNTAAFGVWPGSAGGEAPSPVQYLYLRGAKPEALIGLSPLPPAHPSTFQRKPVRPSSACHGAFSLAGGRSQGFASAAGDSTPSSGSLSLRVRASRRLPSPPTSDS